MGKKSEPTEALVQHFWLVGSSRKKLEKLSNKIIDTLFKKWGDDIGVISGQFVDYEVLMGGNAIERALERLEEPVPMPWGRNQSFTHGYNAAMAHARRVVREEATRYHGL